jgi:hypothetical protein
VDCPDPVVAGIVSQFGQAERLEQGREIHPESTPVTLAQPVPTADRIIGGTTPGLDGAGGRLLFLLGRAQRDSIVLLQEPRP